MENSGFSLSMEELQWQALSEMLAKIGMVSIKPEFDSSQSKSTDLNYAVSFVADGVWHDLDTHPVIFDVRYDTDGKRGADGVLFV